MFTLQCRGKLLTTQRPLVMGILNITPDSFFEGHLSKELSAITEVAGTLLAEGADILDIGGQSTRPGSTRISAEEEAGIEAALKSVRAGECVPLEQARRRLASRLPR